MNKFHVHRIRRRGEDLGDPVKLVAGSDLLGPPLFPDNSYGGTGVGPRVRRIEAILSPREEVKQGKVDSLAWRHAQPPGAVSGANTRAFGDVV